MYPEMTPENRRLVIGLAGYLVLVQTALTIDRRRSAKARKARQLARTPMLDLSWMTPKRTNPFEQLDYDLQFNDIIADF